MKWKLLIVSLIVTVASHAQPVTGYTWVNHRYRWLAGQFNALNIPFGCDTVTALQTGQTQWGAPVYYDTCARKLYVRSAGAWRDQTTAQIDSLLFSTRAWRQKGVDSVVSLLGAYLLKSDTAAMLGGYVRRNELKDTAAAIRSTIGSGSGGSFGKTDTLQAENRYVNMANYNFKWKDPGSVYFGAADSLGARLNYSWATDPLDAAVWSSSGTAPTTGSGVTTINGTNTLTSVIKTGAENFTFKFTVITNTKSSAVQSVSVLVKPDTLSASTTRKITWLLADTSGYINMFRNDGASTPLASNRGYQSFTWAANDTIDCEAIFRTRYILAFMTNRANGQRSYFRYDLNAAVGNVGPIQVLTTGNFTFLNNFIYKIDEISRPDFLFLGPSTTAGSGVALPNERWVNKLMERTSNTWAVSAGGGERAISLISREDEATDFFRPRYVVVEGNVNDLNGGSIALYSQYMRRFLDSTNTHGIGCILLSLPPQASNVATFNDTTQAIATAKGCRYINQTTVLQTGSADFNKNALYKPTSDAIHVNAVGQNIVADVVYDGLVGIIKAKPALVLDNIPSSNKSAWLLATNENNEVIRTPTGIDSGYIRNDQRQAGETIANGQTGGLFVTGDITSSSIMVTGNGTTSNPAFQTTSAGATSATNFTSNNMNNSGSSTTFSSNYIQFTNSTYIRSLSANALRIFINISSNGAGNLGVRLGTESNTPASNYTPVTVEVSDSIKARFTRNGGLVVNDQGHAGIAGAGFRAQGSADTALLVTDPDNDRVGVGTIAPREKLDVFSGLISYRGATAASAASSDSTVVIEDGRLKTVAVAANITDGTWTPTLTTDANCSGLTAFQGSYHRTNNTVTGQFHLTYTSTVAATLTKIGFTLPVASALTLSTQLGGTCSDINSNGQVIGDATNDRGQLNFLAPSVNATMVVHFTYTIL